MKDSKFKNRSRLLLSAALATVSSVPGYAMAQDAPAAEDTGGLEEIIVTAQKREQSMQDVAVAVTALTQDTIQANRVQTVNDLTGLAPGVTVRPSAGGVQIPTFTMRGAVSYGVVPGSDKQVSVYLDGVYISSPRGSIFDLPDVARIEVLRGPQGTLFGRNSTAGAVSVSTRDPDGEAGVTASVSVGNFDQYRLRLSASTPQIGPFSGYFSFMRNYKRGDIRNAGAGTPWDRSASPGGYGIGVSPRFLGTKDANSYFAALNFEPSDSFKTVYKFDRTEDESTPEAMGFIGFDPTFPGVGAVIGALVNSQPASNPALIYPNGKRPKVVNNSWAIPNDQKVTGHSLTSTWEASDSVTVKNVASMRKSSIFAVSPIDGFSGLTTTQATVNAYVANLVAPRVPGFFTLSPAAQAGTIALLAGPTQFGAFVGQPFVGIVSQAASSSKQWSNELQLNYESKALTLTAGAIWFKSSDVAGAPERLPGTTTLSFIPGGVIGIGSGGRAFNKATSLAAYTQAEVHATEQLDVILGARITKDHKYGSFNYGVFPAIKSIPFDYKKTKPNFLVGLNYKPNDDVLLYGKYSTAFVSGGSVATIDFKPETVESFELGAKADLFNKRLRTNLAIYQATYKNLQTAQGGTNFTAFLNAKGALIGEPNLASVIGTFILPQGGPVRARGFELEATGLVTRGLTVGSSLAYSKTTYKNVNPVLVASQGGFYVPTLRPKWTGGLWGQFKSEPFAGDARFVLRVDGNYRSKMNIDANPNRTTPAFLGLRYSPSTWIVNGRAAITDINLGGVKTELAVWGKNLTNDDSVTFALINGFEASANYQAARSFGADLTISF